MTKDNTEQLAPNTTSSKAEQHVDKGGVQSVPPLDAVEASEQLSYNDWFSQLITDVYPSEPGMLNIGLLNKRIAEFFAAHQQQHDLELLGEVRKAIPFLPITNKILDSFEQRVREGSR